MTSVVRVGGGKEALSLRFLRNMSSWLAGLGAAISSSVCGAQVPDLHLRGNLPGQLSSFGVAMRDAIRAATGECNETPGMIVVCKRRNPYRIDRSILSAGRDYNRYLEAKERNRSHDDF